MACNPQLHLYEHMPEDMRKVEATDLTWSASNANVLPAKVVQAATRKPIWRFTLVRFFSPVATPQLFQNVAERAGPIRSINRRSEVRNNSSNDRAPDFSTAIDLHRSRTNKIHDRREQASLMQIKGVEQSPR